MNRRRWPRMAFSGLLALVLLVVGGCGARLWCGESPCWPGPRLGPVCPGLCREPRLEGPCPECPPPPCPPGDRRGP